MGESCFDDNLFDAIERIAVGDRGQAQWTARAPYRPGAPFDLILVPRVPAWERHEQARRALERIEAEPAVESVRADREGARLRLREEWVARRGEAIEAGEGFERSAADLAAGRRYAVYFWGANTTKALHIGHLRNLAVGNALGTSLVQAGAEAEHRSLICDVGRSMGEAMAGILGSGNGDSALPRGGAKADHFVGACYSAYVKASRNGAGANGDGGEDSVARESTLYRDKADELMARMLSGDRPALELWSKTRAWVIAGQRKTLARLGVAFDKVIFESDYLPEIAELAGHGLGRGVLSRRPDGVVVYPTEREELEEIPLLRSDGLPTQSMRALAYWSAAPDLDGVASVQVCGTEWVTHVSCWRQLIDELGVANANASGSADGGGPPTHDVFHGMVERESRSVGSSKGGALLIDEVVEWLDQELSADPRGAAVLESQPRPERIAPRVALGYFLLQPATKRADFAPERLLREGQGSLGWELALAAAHRPGGPALGAGRTADPDYRFAVVQAETYRRHLRSAVESFDVLPLARYLSHFARWYREAPRAPEVERVARRLIERGVRGLGLEGPR